MPRFVYREDGNGNVEAVPVERLEQRHGDPPDDFESRMRKTFHDLECKEGSRFRVPGFSPSQLKRAWERDPIGP